MRVTQDKPKYRPITIVLEDQDDYDALLAVVSQVAQNKINHPVAVIGVAKSIVSYLTADSLEVL